MSTRATYCFQGGDWHPTVTFYIHHDGYPSGAAEYFQKMLDHEGSMESCNHGSAEVFFRANERAEFTHSHDSHGDTEYRYTVKGKQLTAHRRKNWPDDDDRWEQFFTGTIEEFVQKHARSYA